MIVIYMFNVYILRINAYYNCSISNISEITKKVNLNQMKQVLSA